MKKIIEIKENVKIVQEDKIIILEKGDRIQVLEEDFVQYENQTVEIKVNRPNWSKQKIYDILDEVMNNFDSFYYSLGSYRFVQDGREVIVGCVPTSGSVIFDHISIL